MNKTCLEEVLSRASAAEIERMMSFIVNPSAGDTRTVGIASDVKECSK